MSKHSTPIRGLLAAPRSPIFQGRFGRMFQGLPPATFGAQEADNLANLKKLADAMKGPNDPPKDGKDDEESGIPTLYTYLGQFIDHDLTFDPASSLQKQIDPNALADFRDPAFDLDCIYGRGPDDQPYMYDGAKFFAGAPLTGAGDANASDLLRNPNNQRAIIGDPRNDENTIVSQLQGLFQRFHNRVLTETGKQFEEVQQIVRFHYQFVVLNDFLPRVVHHSVLDKLRSGDHFDHHKLEFYHWRNDPFMPVEFSGACYRFGHSMVRPGYRVNDKKENLFSIFPDLVGFGNVTPDRALDWGRFIDVAPIKSNDNATNRLQLAYRIDTSLVEPLSNLPKPRVVATDPVSLAERNLTRGWRLGLPSGQSVARAMGVRPLADEQIWIGQAVDDNLKDPKKFTNIVDAAGAIFKDNCPLWTYILAEAMHNVKCDTVPATEKPKVNTPQLGPVGGRIVAEVFLGLMFADAASLLSLDRNWTPPGNSHYKLKDFVNYALGK